MIEWNTVKYIDCMDKKEGLPSLPDKSIDLCLTDPPYNIGYKFSVGSNEKRRRRGGIHYNDNIPNYYGWCHQWFGELLRVCNKIIFTPGTQNLKFWYENYDPIDIFIYYKKNGCFGGRVSVFNCFEPFLYFGKSKQYFLYNVMEETSTVGFLKKQRISHASPKNRNIWYRIIASLNPESVIDPFLGSGTTAEVCTKLGIPWIGYELNEVYSQDINKRLRNCKKEPNQIQLEEWIK
jgi:DNA modification methylase